MSVFLNVCEKTKSGVNFCKRDDEDIVPYIILLIL